VIARNRNLIIYLQTEQQTNFVSCYCTYNIVMFNIRYTNFLCELRAMFVVLRTIIRDNLPSRSA